MVKPKTGSIWKDKDGSRYAVLGIQRGEVIYAKLANNNLNAWEIHNFLDNYRKASE